MKTNIFLIGMPASGKSTVGVILAKTAGLHFLDTDITIQEQEGRTLQAIIDADGVPYLLRAEQRAILSTRCSETVIATGGSAVFSEKAMEHLKADGTAVYLKLPYEEIERRLTNLSTRGVAADKGMTLLDIYKLRTPLYEAYADLTIDCIGKSPEQVAEEILQKRN